MKRGLILFLAACTLAAAMVPRDRRAVNTEEEEERLKAESTTIKMTETLKVLICEPQTPCGWSIYHPVEKYIETNITNTYCKCAEGTTCQIIKEEISSSNSYDHKCKLPAELKDAAADS